VTFAQTPSRIDSLWQKLEYEKSDTTKAGILCDIAYLMYSINADSSLTLCQKGLKLLEGEVPSTSKGLCLMNMGLAYSVKGDKFSALEYFFLARDFFLATKANRQLSDCLINIGMAEYELKNIDKAIEYTNEALEFAKKNENNIQLGSCYQNLGLFNKQKRNLTTALDYFQKALAIKKEYNDEPRRIANTLDAIAGVYEVMDDKKSALEYYEQALKLREESGDVIGSALSYYNIGVFYHKQGDFAKALSFYEVALKKSEEIPHPGLIGYCQDAIGNAYTDLGNPDKGIVYIKKSLALREKIGDKGGYIHTLLNLADAYQKKGNLRKALESARAFEQFKDEATPDDQLAYEKSMQEIYVKKHNYRKAFSHLMQANKIERSLDSLANQKALAESRAAFEFDMAQKDHDLAIKEKENEINNIRVANKNFIIKVFGVGLVLLLGLLGLVLYNYLQKRKAYKEVASQNKELEEKNRKIDIANKNLKELNQKLAVSNNSLQQFTFAASHDLKESLRTITSFSQIIKKDVSSAKKQDSTSNVDFIISSGKKMHKTLDDLLSYVNLNFAKEEETEFKLTEIVETCEKEIFSDVEFSYFLEIETPFPILKAKRSMIHELVCNILENAKEYRKKGQPLHIKVGCKSEKGTCVYYFRDNGIGVDPKYLNYIFEPFKRLNSRTQSGSGLGLAVGKKVVEMYGGNIWASSDGHEGTTISFSLPNAVKK